MKLSTRYILITIIYFSIHQFAFAQLEQNTWFFGGGLFDTQAGIRFDFVTNEPTQYNEVRYPLKLQENNIIVSNPSTGEVVFYSDGQLVIDATHQPMPDGTDLSGNPSTLYGTAVVFDPSGCDRYFIITVQSENAAVPRKIFYSAVDLAMPGNGTIDNPLGNIDTAVKNIDFTPSGVNCAEGVFALPKAGATKDSWIFFSSRQQQVLYIYQVTSSGISYFDQYDLNTLLPTLPSEDIFDTKMDFHPLSETEGRLVLAPGRNLNQATYPIGSFIFNTETGILDQSSYQLITPNTYLTYGTTFSPDGTKLYFSDYVEKSIKQFDYNTNTLTTIGTSFHNGRTGGLETGPDGKVYWANAFVINSQSTPITRLSVVHQPNLAGLACNLSINDWDIGADISPTLMGALPSFGTFPSPPFVLPLSPDNCGLGNGSAIIDPAESTPPFQYEWDNGETTAVAVQLSSGLHQATITDGQGCERTLEVFIEEENDSVIHEISGDLIICESGNTTTLLEGEAGFESYLWSNDATTPSIVVDTPGVYTLLVTNAEGCLGEASVEVVEQSPSVEIIGDTVLCEGNTEFITLELDGTFDEYLWSDSSNEATLSVNQVGDYSVTVTNAQGCIAIDSFTVSVAPPIEISIFGDPSICEEGNTTTILGSEEGFESYLWSNGATTPSIIVDASGTYTLLVTDSIGCSGEASFEVIEESLTVEISGDTIICEGSSEFITLTVEDEYNNYLWSDSSNEATLSVNHSGIYIVTVTNSEGCMAMDSIYISLIPSPDVFISGDTSICEYGNTTTSLGASEGLASYFWSNGETFQDIEVNTPGVYSVTVSDDSGCTNEAFIQVEQEVVTIDLGDNLAFCEGSNESIVLDAGNGFSNYFWSDQSTEQTLSIIEPGNYSVQVINENGCFAIDSVEVTSIPNPQTSISGDNTLCQFGITQSILDAGDNFQSYLWSNGETNQMIEVSQPGNYSVTITNMYDCTGEASIEIIEDVVEVQISGRDLLCEGNLDSIDLTASEGFVSYQWSEDEGMDRILNIIEAGNYSVTATDSEGCIAIDSISISSVLAPQIVDLVALIEVEFGESVILNPTINSSSPYTFQWTPTDYLSCPDCLSPIIEKPTENLLYNLLVEDDFGCIDTASVAIRVLYDKDVFSPNVFTPNDDNINDNFTIYGTIALKEIRKLQIFDRWGELIFENRSFPPNDPSFGWNGEFNGKKVNPAVFVWLVEVEFFDGTVEFLKGDLTIIR